MTIRQNGYVVYETKVAPGAFEISDLASTGGAGDLDVTIKEADGSEQHLRIPYASLPVLQREGKFRYSVTGGQFRAYDSHTEKNLFVQGTGIYGLPWGFTLYGGVQNAGNKYQSYALGWVRILVAGAPFPPTPSIPDPCRPMPAGNRASRSGYAIAKISCRREQILPSPAIAIPPPDFARWKKRWVPTVAIITFLLISPIAGVTGLSCR